MEIEALEGDLDRMLLGCVADLRRQGPVSFLRANKPTWRLLVERTEPDADAVLDSDAAIEIVRLDLAGMLARSRREIVLASMAWALHRLGLDAAGRLDLHRAGYRWAIENGRWDRVAVTGLESRFVENASGLGALVEAARRGDEAAFGAARARDALVRRWEPVPSGADAGALLVRHANRIGVLAEPLAILHYFLWRLDGGEPERGS